LKELNPKYLSLLLLYYLKLPLNLSLRYLISVQNGRGELIDVTDRFAFEAFAYYFDGYDTVGMATINKIRLAVVLIGILLIAAALISWYLRTH
jgi:hypothetical protein